MTFFTELGIFIATLCVYILFFIIVVGIMHELEDDAAYFGALFVGIIISIIFATFICDPEHYGYQKITVSENVVEVSK